MFDPHPQVRNDRLSGKPVYFQVMTVDECVQQLVHGMRERFLGIVASETNALEAREQTGHPLADFLCILWRLAGLHTIEA